MAVITVASIQSGSETIAAADGTSHDVTITSVTTANSIVMYTLRGGETATPRLRRHTFIASLTGATTLNFSRDQSAFAQDCIVEWTVVEFDSGVLNNLQTGTVDRTAADDDTTITSVDTAKTFVLMHLKTDDNNLLAQVTCNGSLTSSTNLRFSSSSTPTTGESVIGYQVVEFASDADVTIQGGTFTISSASESATDTITSVDTSKAFVIHAGVKTSQTSNTLARNICRLKLSSATAVQGDRTTNGTSQDQIVGYFVVELSGSGHAVEAFDTTIADTATTPTQPSWTALSTTDTAIMSGWLYNTRAENTSPSAGEASNYVSISLDAGADGATLTRVSSSGAVETTGYAVDFTGGGATYTLTADGGTYTLTGGTAGLTASRTITAAQGTYTLTGGAAGLNQSFYLEAAQGSYTLTGGPALLTPTIPAEQGSYTLTGGAVTFTYNSGATYSLTAEQGSYTLAGGAMAFDRHLLMVAATGSYTLTGGNVTFDYSGAETDTPTGGWEEEEKGNYDFLNPPTREAVRVSETVQKVAKKQVKRETETQVTTPKKDRIKELREALERQQIELTKEHEARLEAARDKAINDAIRDQLILNNIIEIEIKEQEQQDEEEMQMVLLMLANL